MTARWQQRIVVETAFSVTSRFSLVDQNVAFVFSLRRTSRSKRNRVVRRFCFEDQSRIDAVCREIRQAKFLELTLWGHARQSLRYETSSGSAKDIALHTSTRGDWPKGCAIAPQVSPQPT